MELPGIVVFACATLRVFNHIELVLSAKFVCNVPEIPPMLLVVLHTLSVNKGNGVHNKVAMQVLGVQVGCYHNLKSVAPHTLGKFRPDLLCQFGSDVRFVLKAQIPVISLDTVAFVKLLLNRYELVTGSRSITVNAAYIKLSLGLFLCLLYTSPSPRD